MIFYATYLQIVQKSDGGYLYATTDLAALYHRVHDEAADRVIYVTDAGQAQHFAMVFKAAEMAGILHENNSKRVELTHVPFGLVLGEDGKKIKSRAGDSVKLRELLAEAVRLAAENEAAKIGSNSAVAGVATPTLGQVGGVGNVLSALEQGPLGLGLQDKARIIGLGAVKYADLSMHRESNYKFSFNKMLSLSGNTAPYMLYAYVRIRGIQRKAAASLQGEDENQRVESHMVLDSPAELALAKQLVRFHEVLLDVSTSLCPNKVILADATTTSLVSCSRIRLCCVLCHCSTSCASTCTNWPSASTVSTRAAPCCRLRPGSCAYPGPRCAPSLQVLCVFSRK